MTWAWLLLIFVNCAAEASHAIPMPDNAICEAVRTDLRRDLSWVFPEIMTLECHPSWEGRERMEACYFGMGTTKP